MNNTATIDQHLQNIIRLSAAIGRPVRLMEVCGTHTMAAFRTGLRSMLPSTVELLSGPGCPVCVTNAAYLDKAIALARMGATITSFGDMIRVPSTESSLNHVRAQGADVRIVYSPTDALHLARKHPETKVVFLGIGFETTTPTIAWTIKEARDKDINNFSVLCGHKTVPEAMSVLLQDDDVRIDGFLCPGHVSIMIGASAYQPLCTEHHIPCVVTGFEARDMSQGIEMLMQQISQEQSEVQIQYSRSVQQQGNPAAKAIIDEVFEKCHADWRGIGTIPNSGLKIRASFAQHDADHVFGPIDIPVSRPPAGCKCGDVLRGIINPTQCKLFRTVCTPSNPVGPCMVSSEGTCAAYHKYAKRKNQT